MRQYGHFQKQKNFLSSNLWHTELPKLLWISVCSSLPATVFSFQQGHVHFRKSSVGLSGGGWKFITANKLEGMGEGVECKEMH